MKLKCPECGKNECITAETHSAIWNTKTEKWDLSDEITGPFTCQNCSCETKYVDAFICSWEPKNHWKSHPEHPVSDWIYEVTNGDTRLGYVDWVNAQLEMEIDD